MLFFISWLILFLILSALALFINYWSSLFVHQDTYTREELLDPVRILRTESSIFLEGGRGLINGLAMILAPVVLWIFAGLGGLLSPDYSEVPDFAENTAANLFFQSILLPLLFYFLFPVIRDLTSGQPSSIPGRMYAHRIPFLLVLSHALAALNLAVWGVYHQTYFLTGLLDGSLAFLFSLFLLRVYARESPGSADEAPDLDSQEDSFPDEDGFDTSKESGSTGDSLEDLDLPDFGDDELDI